MKSKRIFKAIFPVLFFLLTATVKAQTSGGGFVPCGNPDQKPCTWQNLMDMVQKIFTYALTYVAIPVAVIMIAWGGITMATSAGNEGKFKKGREVITAAAIGLVIIFAAWLIINTITKFLGIPSGATS